MEVVGLEQNVIDRSLEAAVVGSALWLAVLSVCRDEWCTKKISPVRRFGGDTQLSAPAVCSRHSIRALATFS